MSDHNWRNLLAAMPGSMPADSPNVRNGDLNPILVAYMRSLFRVAEAANARSVLEVGVEHGHSSMAFAYAMRDRIPAAIVSLEVNELYPTEERRRAVGASGVFWDVKHVDSRKAEIEGEFDVLYIDGAKENTVSDFMRYGPRVRTGGYVVIDDFPCFPDVVRARQELAEVGIRFLFMPYGPGGDGNGHLIWHKEAA